MRNTAKEDGPVKSDGSRQCLEMKNEEKDQRRSQED